MALTVEAVFIVLILIYYFVGASISVFKAKANSPREASSRGHVRGKSESPPPPAWTSLQKAQLVASVFVVSLSIARSTIRALSVDLFGGDADQELVSSLFFTLVWIILLLGLFDFSHGPTYPHYGAWLLSLLVQVFLAVQKVSQAFSAPNDAYILSSTIVQCISLATVFALLIGTIIVKRRGDSRKTDTDADIAERQPLLADENESAGKEGDKAKEPDEDEKARKELRDRPFFQYIKSFNVYMPFMMPSNARQRVLFLGVCVCTVIARIVNILRPLSLGAVVDGLVPFEIVPWTPIGIYIFLHFLDSAAGVALLQEYLKYRLTREQKLALNRAAYDHIMNLSADFHDSKRSSHIWQSMFQARSVISLFHDILFGVSPSIFDLLAGISVLWTLFGPYMGFIVATTVTIFIWMTAKSLGSKQDMQRKYTEAWHDEVDQLVDSSTNWKAVTEFDQISYEMGRYREKGLATQTAQQKIIYYSYYTRGSRYFVLVLAFLAACSLAAVEISYGTQIKVGRFVVLTSYWGQLTGPLQRLVSEVNETTEKLVDAEKLLILLEKVPTIQNVANAKPFQFLGGGVEFEDVSFSYDGKRPVSEGVTFRAAPGTTVALVGETGGGKSTLLKLLFRFYDAKQGRIMIDGQDVRDLTMESFRQRIGIVPQDPALFNTTVLENIRYPDPTLSEEEVQEACKAVALHEKIMSFSKGYHEKVGERGARLSGGELQRLAIARAILKKPDMLLLDEATSSVDSITEAQIQASLDKLCRGKTTFVIAHRLSTILKADQILVIKGGKLLESGTHSELLKKKGAYHELWSSQLKLQGDLANSSGPPAKKDGLTLINDLRQSEDEVEDLVKSTTEKADTVDEGQNHASSEPLKEDDSGFEDAKPAHPPVHASHEAAHDSTNNRGRPLAKQMVRSFKDRLSASKSANRDKSAESPEASPVRSRLNGEAAEFVPRNSQQDGAGDVTTPGAQAGVPISRTSRRQTVSEPAKNGEDEANDSESSTSGEQGGDEEGQPGKYSRIPRKC